MGDLKELSLSDNVISEIPQDLSVFYLLESHACAICTSVKRSLAGYLFFFFLNAWLV